MKRIVIAYHGYMYGEHYMDIMVEQFRKIVNAKFFDDGTFESNIFTNCYKLYIGIVDDPDKKPAHGREWIQKFWSFSSSKVADKVDNKVEIVFYPENNELRDTLKWIRDWSAKNPDDYILFFHSKGVHQYSKPTQDWRRYMEYFVIERWKECVKKLDEGYDCCGVMWNSNTHLGWFPHFSGAFYWVKASYVNTLDHSYLDNEQRLMMEFWIGTNLDVKAYEFHNSRLNDRHALRHKKSHYTLEYPREKYFIHGEKNSCGVHGF